MQEPNSSPDGSDPWKTWVDHWRFSNYTGFRIPEYLASVLGAWRQVSQILLDATQAPEPIHFFRHPLLPEDKEARTAVREASPLVQFTQSSILSRLLTPSFDSVESTHTRSIFKEKAEHFRKTLNKQHWLDLIEAINEHPGSNFSESEFDTGLLKSFPDKLPADKELPQLFHQLFLAFSSINHKGFIQYSLNCHHLSLEPLHREKIVGYLVATENKKRSLPDIRSIREIRLDRKNRVSSFIRNRKQKEPFDILDANRDGDFSSLLLSLWQTLNLELTGADKNLYLAVPVYAWSESPTDDHLLRTSRARGGALLGWALHRCPEEITPRNFNTLYQHVRSLCFMMEDFAINYLSGETEWALEREWENGDTPESFMKRNFHHCCGWTCNAVDDGSMEDYFQRKEQGETGKSQLKVNLTRRLQTIAAQTVEPKIAYLHPNSLCLEPSGVKERDSYLASVAEKARHFYSRCLAIAEKRKKAELAGRIGEWATFGHEMKHVAAALSGRWFVPPGGGGEILGHAIAPVPELIAGAGSMIYLWCPTGDVRELLPNWNPESSLLMQSLERVWEMALYGILASLAKTKRLDNSASVKEVAALVNKAKEIWQFSKWWKVQADSNALNKPTSLGLQRILRAFSILSNNLIRHASISDNLRSCLFTVDNLGNVRIDTDTACEPRDGEGNYLNCLSKEFPSLNNVRSGVGGTKSQGLGQKILVDIVQSELEGSYVIESNPRHKVKIFIPAGKL